MTVVVHAVPCRSQCLINALVESAPRGALERHPLTFTARGQRYSPPPSLLTHLPPPSLFTVSSFPTSSYTPPFPTVIGSLFSLSF